MICHENRKLKDRILALKRSEFPFDTANLDKFGMDKIK